jgi:NAD(P)H-hydrate epimerase
MAAANDVVRITAVPRLAARDPDGHKGTYGRVLVVAGGRGMAGAAVLSGTAVLRGGAGLATVACPLEVQPTVAAGFPCYTTAGLPTDPGGRLAADAVDPLLYMASDFDVIAVGPGLGRSRAVTAVVHGLLGVTDTPVVLDADGLNALDRPPADLFARRAAGTVLTPHPGEFARLTGTAAADVQRDRERFAVAFARQFGVVLLLKGGTTIVTDGRRVYANTTGNPGMATGGSGDVLTGLIAALIGQKLAPFEAAVLGCWAHGRAGDLAAADLGQTGMTARDVLDRLPLALREAGG